MLCLWAASAWAAAPADTLRKPDRIKKGWNFGALPSVLFNSDLGFQYGLLANIFNYGDGSVYPDYRYSFYTEWSRTTKGGGINQLFFDSKYLMPWGMRITADFSFLTQQALDFYGFNGYEARYNPDWEDRDSPDYISRMFYRLGRELIRLDASLQKPIGNSPFRLMGGLAFFRVTVDEVDLGKLNKGLSPDRLIPDVPGLYRKYVDWGLITDDEKEGGNIFMVKAGMVYDTRDNEPNPMKGLWSEALIAACPSVDKRVSGYVKLVLIHRQYFTIIRDRLSLATRLGYQGSLTGKVPFYMQPYMINSFPKTTTVDGLGGSRTIRGILRNRVVGDAIAYGNFELRYKIVRAYFWRQNFYFALTGFADAGQVVKAHPVNWELVPIDIRPGYRGEAGESLHLAYGWGLKIAMNQNFVISADYGRAADQRDGRDGMYIGLNFLF